MKPRSVGKRNKIILNDVPLNTPNPELILRVAKSWKWYQELAKEENRNVETTTRNLPLASLNPDQLEKLFIGHHAPDLSVAKLLSDRSLI